MSDALNTLLNQVEAILDCRASNTKELASFLRKRPEQVSEWVRQRTHEPSGRIALQMQTWAANKTIGIAATENRAIQSAYRAAFREVQQRRGK